MMLFDQMEGLCLFKAWLHTWNSLSFRTPVFHTSVGMLSLPQAMLFDGLFSRVIPCTVKSPVSIWRSLLTTGITSSLGGSLPRRSWHENVVFHVTFCFQPCLTTLLPSGYFIHCFPNKFRCLLLGGLFDGFSVKHAFEWYLYMHNKIILVASLTTILPFSLKLWKFWKLILIFYLKRQPACTLF